MVEGRNTSPYWRPFILCVLSKMKDYLTILAIGLLCVSGIIWYGTFRCKNPEFTDPLTFSLTDKWGLDKYFDGWGMSHLFFFMLLGYLFPRRKQLLFSFVLGVLWELAEYSIKEYPFYLTACQIKTHKGEGWWYGRWQDIVMNSVGLWMGASLSGKRF